ncbi:hypothetical protein N657DRAFT_641529 [Parathielavia appendiculata]|uniref:CID domain-containing protein n=1 Tax=Parathielavia appendiculata TaxID=2587402 RepID=A0AAN6U7P5_9PEZI|nr:hypothetical protein N657DRAFT_641529 [Parathielavia appendiculata]
MASAELIVAKTALSGALFRADPRPCSRDDIESMLGLVNATITECSPSNVQRCKQWALSNLVPSSSRIAPFCKYLVALSKSIGGEKDATALDSKAGRVPSAKRRRLHVLYILNDILYHVKHRNRDDGFALKLEPTISALVRSAASFNNCPKHIRKIQNLIGLWEENGYFARTVIQQLRAAVEEGPTAGGGGQSTDDGDSSASAVAKAAKSAPWVMPAMHGDPSTPWYDLPAGNWMPVLEPNSTRPINPAMIKPLVLAQGPADKSLVEAVKSLLVDVERIYSKEVNLDEPPPNVGRLGERVEIDELTGDIIDGDTYYGWSRAFCEKMKRRRRVRIGRNGRSDGDRGRTRSTSYTRSDSRSRSRPRDRSDVSSRSSERPDFKRQRMSGSPPSRSRGRSRSRSPSGRRSPDRHRSRSYQRSRSRSRSPSGRRSQSRSRSRSRGYRYRRPNVNEKGKCQPQSPDFGIRSRSRSWSRPGSPLRSQEPPPPSRNGYVPQMPAPSGTWNQHPPPPPPPSMATYPIPPPIPSQQGFGLGFPVPPPPPPPTYQAPWPPAPPSIPPPPMVGQQSPNFFVPPGNAVPPPPFPGGWPPVPPPGPPVGNHDGFYPQGQYRVGHQGRGGYGRGGWR